jgi:hypothetical protein
MSGDHGTTKRTYGATLKAVAAGLVLYGIDGQVRTICV